MSCNLDPTSQQGYQGGESPTGCAQLLLGQPILNALGCHPHGLSFP